MPFLVPSKIGLKFLKRPKKGSQLLKAIQYLSLLKVAMAKLRNVLVIFHAQRIAIPSSR